MALYDDQLKIISIGDLHFGLTPAALFREHESKPWNPVIAGTFDRRGLIEAWGRGTLKIASLMREAGLAPPEVAVRAGAVVVIFTMPGRPPGKTPGKTPTAILDLLAATPELPVPEIAERLAKSECAIHRPIRALRESGRLGRVGPAKGGHWKVMR